jgi:UDP-glucose 4-epimerase
LGFHLHAATGVDLVTGGAGFIGSHLVDRLIAQGRRVRVLDSLVVGRRANLHQHKDNPSLDLVEADVADKGAVDAATEGVERVFHLAARADIVPSIQEPEAYFRANVDGTFAVLEAARRHKVKRLVYVASSSCYGIPPVYPTPEDAPIDPRYPYALTKYLGEQLMLHWAQVYRLPAVSVRFFNVYGPRARTSGTYGAVFGVFLAQLLAGKPLTVVGDGTQTRDFTFVSDVVDALLTVAASDRSGEVYNVGSGQPVSVNELVRELGASDIVHIPKRPGEPDCTWADISKIRRDLGWEPKVSFADGVAVMRENIDYWRDAPVWTASRIAEATTDWFRYLGEDTKLKGASWSPAR